jgi:magnesium-transporting ATPase (P-type)
MISLKNILLLFGITGIIVFVINDVLYYTTDTNQIFLEHIIIGWLIFISTILTFILLYKEKK